MNAASIRFLSAVIFSIASAASAYSGFDTLKAVQVCEGVYHYHVVDNSKPVNLNVLKVDLKNPYIKIRSVKATERLTGNDWTSAMAAKHEEEGFTVIGAVNGDFYDGSGTPIGMQIINGEILTSNTNTHWSKIAFTGSMNPLLGSVSFSGSVTKENISAALHGVNKTRSTNEMILYNRFMGNSTGTNQYGTELLLSPLSEWYVNDTVIFVVDKKIIGVGNEIIEAGKVVLSGHGSSSSFINDNFSAGDTIKIYISVMQNIKRIKEMVSGFPKIVKNGINYALQGYSEEGGTATFATDRHPRTAAGFSADSSQLFLAVVDGRQSFSRGMSLPEFADFLIGIGAHTAVNLDGGGSSTIVVKDEIKNSPSSGPERAVSNALLVLTSEPQSIAKITLKPDSVVTDLQTAFSFTYSAEDNYGFNTVITLGEIGFTLDNLNAGSIDASGKFTPSGEGITNVIAEAGGVSDTSIVNVEVIEGNVQLSSFDTLENWILTGSEIDTNNSAFELTHSEFTESGSAIKINYEFTYKSGTNHWLYLDTDIPLYGIPKYFQIDGKSDKYNHNLALVVENNSKNQFAILSNKSLSADSSFDTLQGEFSKAVKINPSSTMYYPVRLKRIAIMLGSDRINGELYKGTITLDNLRLIYPSTSAGDEINLLPEEFKLHQNYPNPFNPGTRIEFSIPEPKEKNNEQRNVALKIYDILGNKIITLIDEAKPPGVYEIDFTAAGLASGVYFYQLTVGSFSETRKMILIK